MIKYRVTALKMILGFLPWPIQLIATFPGDPTEKNIIDALQQAGVYESNMIIIGALEIGQ